MRVLRCLTLNLWGTEGPAEERFELVRAGLKELAPDVVAFQEVKEQGGETTAARLARAAGYNLVFADASPPGHAGDRWGLAILARDPVVDHAATDLPDPEPGERRILLSARIDTDAGAIWVHDTHLNYKLQDGPNRERQVMAIARAVSERAGDSPQIVMGDFNARPEADEIRWMRGQTTLAGERACFQDAWARVHPLEPGWTWASANPYTKALQFLDLDRRIDYLFVTPERKDGRGRVLDCRIVLDRPGAGGVFASDHFGLLADIQMTAT